MKRIIITTMPEESRIAITDEAGVLTDILYERPEATHTVNHIYKGVVRNVLPGMASAFVDIGRGQNAYLNLKHGKQTREMGKLFVGQVIMVQAVKEEMRGKGIRVSADISLAGRFMVLLPYSKGIHISKKITDTSRRQALESMAAPYLAKGCGFILRTAAADAKKEDIAADMEFLWQTWEQLQRRFAVAKNGTEIYSDADVWLRLLRDYVGRGETEIVADDEAVVQRLEELCRNMAAMGNVVIRYVESKEDIFKHYEIDTQIEALVSNRVELPSGGFLQIDYTEALTVIDVNSGHFTGGNPGETARIVNMEAADAICRQLRLRDIGGIILCDFIDMPKKEQREALIAYLTKRVRYDRVKTVVCGITSLGLVEMTRKRERQGLQSLLFDTCSHCGGSGTVLSAQTVYLQILRRLRQLSRSGRLKTDIMITVHPEVGACFTKGVLKELHQELQRDIRVECDAVLHREAYSLLAVNE